MPKEELKAYHKKKLKKGKAKPWNTQNFTSPQALPSSKKITLR